MSESISSKILEGGDFLVFGYLIFDIQLDIRLIFGGGGLGGIDDGGWGNKGSSEL